MDVACCSRAVRSAAADSCSVSRPAHLLGLALAGDVGAGPDPFDDLPVPLNRDGRTS